jgi:tetratricopeptide (TPR) repeat protein
MPRKYLLSILILVTAGIIIGLTVASYQRNRAYETAVTLWADASSKSKDKRRTHENYGQALSTAGAASENRNDALALYNEAVRQFQTVLALKDDGSVPPRDLYREIGVVYFRIGLIDDAITAWQTGLHFAPGDPSLLNNLSIALIKKKRYDEAEVAVRQALQADPNMPYLLNTMGEILVTKGNYEEALKYFLAAIERQPDNPSRYWNAAVAFEKIGRYDMAYEYASRFRSMETDPVQRQRVQLYLDRLQSLQSPKR